MHPEICAREAPEPRWSSLFGRELQPCVSHDFNQNVDALAQCANLKTIQFGRDPNQNVDTLAQCANLTTIQFGRDFNQNVDALGQCANLTTIHFDHDFNQNLDCLGQLQCTNLTTIFLTPTFITMEMQLC
jgi:hypothetical protein